jgi:hypothetical protein
MMAFYIYYGLFKWLVTLLGLANAPSCERLEPQGFGLALRAFM